MQQFHVYRLPGNLLTGFTFHDHKFTFHACPQLFFGGLPLASLRLVSNTQSGHSESSIQYLVSNNFNSLSLCYYLFNFTHPCNHSFFNSTHASSFTLRLLRPYNHAHQLIQFYTPSFLPDPLLFTQSLNANLKI